MEFIAATNNAHKLAEMRRILVRMGHTVLSQRRKKPAPRLKKTPPSRPRPSARRAKSPPLQMIPACA